MTTADSVQHRVVGMLIDRGFSIATGESLTAGMIAAALADVPGCSAVLRGGVVAYQTEVKHQLLGIPHEVLQAGTVTADVAVGLAIGARQTLGAQVGVGATGAAGPQPHDGQPPGTAWIAVSIEGAPPRVEQVRASGMRADVRTEVTRRALELTEAALGSVPVLGE